MYPLLVSTEINKAKAEEVRDNWSIKLPLEI
jgi:hypothetical protein